MTILLTQNLRVGGVVLNSGTTQTFGADLEADIVARKGATYLTDPTPGKTVPVFATTDVTGGITLSAGGSQNFDRPRILAKTGVPAGIAPSGNVGTNGFLTLGAFPSGSITFGATSGTGIALVGVGTGFVAGDVNKVITCDTGKTALITAVTDTLNITVTITGTLSGTAFANNAWQMSPQLVGYVPTYYPAGVHDRGIYLYFPAGKVYAGSLADFYWVKMSSVTVGTIYDNKLSGIAKQPTTQTPIVAAGPGVYTGATSVNYTAATVTIPGNSMGPNGTVVVNYGISMPNSAGNKQLTVLLGNMTAQNLSQTTFRGLKGTTSITNRNSASSQIAWNSTAGDTGGNCGNIPIGSIDTTTDQPLTVVLQMNTPGEFIILDMLEVLVNFHPAQ